MTSGPIVRIQVLIDDLTEYLNPLKIRGLVFDFGSVLAYSTTPETRSKQETALRLATKEQFGLDEDQSVEFLSEIRKIRATFKERKLFLGTGTCFDEGFLEEYSLHQMIVDALTEIGVQPIEDTFSPDVIESLCAVYRTPSVENKRIIKGVHEFLKWSKNHHIRCAVCSNYFDAERTLKVLERDNLSHYFDPIIISSEIGFRKPDYRILEPILKQWSDLSLSEIIFLGDNPRHDILLAHYSNIRSILCRFTDPKETKLPDAISTNQRMLNDSFIDTVTNVTGRCVSEEIGYLEPDATVFDYDQMPDAVQQISSSPFTSRPLVVGLFILPHKIAKLAKRNVFDLVHRRDVIFKSIDFNEPLGDQGPFDILIHKIASWYVAAEYDEEARDQLHDCLDYINCCDTNIESKLKGHDDDELQSFYKMDGNNTVNGGRRMLVTDNPENAKLTTDRFSMYNRIQNAHIVVDDVQFTVPQFLLVESKYVESLKETENELMDRIKKMRFPIIAKPRLAVSPVVGGTKNLKSCAHTMCLIPEVTMIYVALSSYKAENEESTDWILQEYIDHIGCHKVYVIGEDVFATVNDSTPRMDVIDYITFIDTGNFSKKPLQDQSGKKMGNVYKEVSKEMRKAFGLNCFGYDMLFDRGSKTGYIVDCNYLPGYKSVPNFSAVFWGFVLKQYFQFIHRN